MVENNVFIELKNVSKQINGKTVLSDVSLDIMQGQIYGFVGANGSGKTMLFRAIAGLMFPSEGTIKFLKTNVSMGVIIENPGFLLTYTGLDNLKLLASLRNIISEADIIETMRKVGLDPYDKRKVKQYSLGMKQRLAIAQAIMEHPDLLILDEPTRGLDEESIVNIRSLLADENKAGATILISSHNKEDIAELCNVVFQLKDGKVTKV